MKDRLKGVFALLPLLISFYTGGWLLYLTSFILTVLGLHELYGVFKGNDIKPVFPIGLATSIYLLIKNIFNLSFQCTTILALIMFFTTAILTISLKNNIIDIVVTYFGIVYIALPFEAVISIYESSSNGWKLALLVFVISFSTDIFAYLIGKNLGKRKLIPSISPNKTIEGSIGALLSAIIITLLYSNIVGINFNIFIVLLGSVCSQIGDLFASSIKRYNKVKDFGDIIPGHGGVIDRFDSILFTAPFILVIVIVFTIL